MDTRDLLVRKYVIDIIFIIVVIALLTWFWFGPYQHKVRIKESLKVNDVYFNNDITYKGFDSLDLSSNKITKNLTVTNDGDEEISFIINFDNLTSSNNNYINYIIIDNEGYQSDIRSLSLDGYILKNNLKAKQTRNYVVILWVDNNIDVSGNLDIILNPIIA